MKKTQENYKQYALELIELLNKWDFLEVTKDGINDEYLDLVGPILSNLYKGVNKEELSEFISQKIKNSYGIKSEPYNLDTFITQVINWWQG